MILKIYEINLTVSLARYKRRNTNIEFKSYYLWRLPEPGSFFLSNQRRWFSSTCIFVDCLACGRETKPSGEVTDLFKHDMLNIYHFLKILDHQSKRAVSFPKNNCLEKVPLNKTNLIWRALFLGWFNLTLQILVTFSHFVMIMRQNWNSTPFVSWGVV